MLCFQDHRSVLMGKCLAVLQGPKQNSSSAGTNNITQRQLYQTYNSLRIRPSATSGIPVTTATTCVENTPLAAPDTPSPTADTTLLTAEALWTASFPFFTATLAALPFHCPVINRYEPPTHHPTPFTARSSTRRLMMKATTRKKKPRAQKMMSLSYQSAFSSCLTRRVDVVRRLE